MGTYLDTARALLLAKALEAFPEGSSLPSVHTPGSFDFVVNSGDWAFLVKRARDFYDAL